MIEQRRKCLIVEDDPVWQDILREFPAQFGCEVHVVNGLNDERFEIERQYFAVALVDWQLSSDPAEPNGLLVLKWLRDLKEATQAILITQNPTIELGFDVASQYSGLGVASKEGFDEPRFLKLFDLALQTADSQRQQQREKSCNGEAEILRGDRPIYLWEPEVKDAVRARDIQLIHTVLSLLVEPLAPITRPKSGSPSVIKKDEHLVHCHFWSRALGRAVNLVFGPEAEVSRLRAPLPAEQIVSERGRLGLAGFAQVDLTQEFNSFESPFDAITHQPHTVPLDIEGHG